MFHFCTYFDKNYLTKGLTLFKSLKKHSDPFRLYVLCMDEETHQFIQALEEQYNELIAIALKDLEAWDDELLAAKKNRSQIEYYFTLSPILPLYVFNLSNDIDIVTYLDADLYFYSNPRQIYDELGKNSILIIEHRFTKVLKKFEKNGRFNVQYQSFRNDKQGVACLERWRMQCLEWCRDRSENGKYADQGYLNEWPDRYDRLVVSQLKGAGAAPWNIAQYEIEINNDGVTVDDKPLVFYHFHSVRKLFNLVYTTEFGVYKLNKKQKNLILLYKKYLLELEKVYFEFKVENIAPASQEIRYNKYQLLLLIKYILKRNLFLKP